MVAVPGNIAFNILTGRMADSGLMIDKAAADIAIQRQTGMQNPVDTEPFTAFGTLQERQVVAGIIRLGKFFNTQQLVPLNSADNAETLPVIRDVGAVKLGKGFQNKSLGQPGRTVANFRLGGFECVNNQRVRLPAESISAGRGNRLALVDGGLFSSRASTQSPA